MSEESMQSSAAKAGHIDGMSIMGVMYLHGRGVPEDGERAESRLLKAANAGKVDAQSILGIMYPRDKAYHKAVTRR